VFEYEADKNDVLSDELVPTIPILPSLSIYKLDVVTPSVFNIDSLGPRV
jgi:hypothetical protein